ncbi:MAG: hypothetical protein RLZZ475_2897, partial [Pseudomonadota bacterium]
MKLALVTGGAAGIGAAIAAALLERGYRVAVADAHIDAVATSDRLTAHVCDVSDGSAVTALF